MSLPPLNVLIGANTSGLDSALASATDRLKRFAGPAGIGAAVGALTEMTRRSMINVDAQAKLARAVGGTTRGLQALARAGDRAGVQTSELQSAATRLNQRLGQVIATGKGAEETFAALGLTAGQLASMDIDERFMALSNAMKQAGLSSQEMSYHLRELGIRQSSVISLVQQGAGEIERSREVIERLGVAVSDFDAAKIEAANDAMSEVGRIFEGVGNMLAVTFAPAVQRTVERFVSFASNVILVIRQLNALRTAAVRFVSEKARVSHAMDEAARAAFDEQAALDNLQPAMAAGQSMSVEMANAKLREAQTRRENIRAIIEERRALGMQTAEYQALSKGIAYTSTQMDSLRQTQRDGGPFAPNANREAIEFHLRQLDEMAGKRQALLDPTGEMTRLLKENDQAIDLLSQGIANAEGGVVTFTGAMHGAKDAVDGLEDALTGGGGGGGGGVQDAMAQRLEALVESLKTEAEVLQEWYNEGLATLIIARERGLLTEQEFMDQRERLEQEHQNRLAQIRGQGHQSALSATIGAGQQILAAVGQSNQKIAKAAQALGQFEAMVNAYRAAAQVLADPSVPWFAKATAAASVLAAGIGFANSIKGMSSGGSGGAGASAGAAGGAQSAQSAQRIFINVQPNARGDIPMETFRGIVDDLNRSLDRGGQIFT